MIMTVASARHVASRANPVAPPWPQNVQRRVGPWTLTNAARPRRRAGSRAATLGREQRPGASARASAPRPAMRRDRRQRPLVHGAARRRSGPRTRRLRMTARLAAVQTPTSAGSRLIPDAGFAGCAGPRLGPRSAAEAPLARSMIASIWTSAAWPGQARGRWHRRGAARQSGFPRVDGDRPAGCALESAPAVARIPGVRDAAAHPQQVVRRRRAPFGDRGTSATTGRATQPAPSAPTQRRRAAIAVLAMAARGRNGSRHRSRLRARPLPLGRLEPPLPGHA